jgi:hypothetical protein
MDCNTQQLHSLAHMLTPAQMTIYSSGCFFTKDSFNKLPVKLNEMAQQQVKYKERTEETLLTTTTTQSFGLSRFPNNAYEAMKLTKGDVSLHLLLNFTKTLKKAINEKCQQNTKLICKLKKCIR